MTGNPEGKFGKIPLELIRKGRYQPRHHFDEEGLEELCESICESGVIQPIALRELQGEGGCTYELLAGERRWRASQMAGLSVIPAMVYVVDDAQAAIIGMAENLQRENLLPIDEAMGYRNLVNEFGLRHEDIAHGLGKSRSAVTNSIRLLDLPEPIQVFVNAGEIKVGHAKVVLSVPKSEQTIFANRIIKGAWSVRKTEAEAKKYLAHNREKEELSSGRKDPDVARLETEVAESLGSPFSITQSSNGFKLEITCYSLDEVDNAVERLKVRMNKGRVQVRE